MLRSTSSTVKKLSFRCRQSEMCKRRDAGPPHGRDIVGDLLGIVHEDLEHVDRPALVEVSLRLGQRHEDHGAVVFRHAHLEDGGHLVRLDARRRAERCCGPARGYQGDGVSDAHAQGVGETRADGDAFQAVESVEGAEADVVGNHGQRFEAILADAAHEAGHGMLRSGRHGLALDQGHRILDAGNGAQTLDGVGVGVEVVAADLLHDGVAVEAQDLVEQLLAEAVHNGHHRYQREHAEQDAEEREAGQHRDEALTAPCPQVAQRQHPFEGREGSGVRRRRGHARLFPRFRPRHPAHARMRRALTTSINRLTAASGTRLMRSPDLRSLTSTSPLLRPFGPTIS